MEANVIIRGAWIPLWPGQGDVGYVLAWTMFMYYLCFDIIMEWSCFVLIHAAYTVALSDAGVL